MSRIIVLVQLWLAGIDVSIELLFLGTECNPKSSGST